MIPMHSRVRVLRGYHAGVEGFYFGLDEDSNGTRGIVGPMGSGLTPISVPLDDIARLYYRNSGWTLSP